LATTDHKFVVKNGLAVGSSIDVINSSGQWVGATGTLNGATGPTGATGISGATGTAGSTGVQAPTALSVLNRSGATSATVTVTNGNLSVTNRATSVVSVPVA
jgi:hypothetical protein